MNYKNKYKYRDFRKIKASRTAFVAYLEATKRRRKAIEVENLASCEIETRELERCERELLACQNKVLDEKKEPTGSLFLEVFIDLLMQMALSYQNNENYTYKTHRKHKYC
ncbi:hypothetical protein [Acidovorax sp. NCPPB 3576]|uniref:hypothetical protein n=1 Tax=Acidovorax sp. NCPPB 3576 TaxID=2940488 RepID=UPI00234A4335|nr:hypothetical protein [Acidovorax sp. NCPPB 3576]WCM90656.1 hypothetical protein M5C98_11840 [Acidovorax sp. NCPPB 3576]